MKKVLSILAVAGMTAIIACGPSAAEKAEKAKQDSIHKADSVNAIMAASKKKDDSIAMVNKAKEDAAKRAADSIAKAAHEDSVAKKLIKPAKEEKKKK
ncbi:MAG TPA: hypothetical protein VNZ86_01515 [Bacteroidia bacterium]|jgi:protein involved in sex pheromone biosynthesis|nr:hypothetical protein [Bacteroidia bacterium]